MQLEVFIGVSEQNTSPIKDRGWSMFSLCQATLGTNIFNKCLILTHCPENERHIQFTCLRGMGFPSEKETLLISFFCSHARILCSLESGSFLKYMDSTDHVLSLGSRTVNWPCGMPSDECSIFVLLGRHGPCFVQLVVCPTGLNDPSLLSPRSALHFDSKSTQTQNT